MQKVKAIINLNYIQENAKTLKAFSGGKLCAVVKANAYGHGAEEVVSALEKVADCFAVAIVEEAIAIRVAACKKDILIFTPPLTEEEALCILQNGFVATVSDLWTANLLINVCKKYKLTGKVHLKINTGMNRYGMNYSMLGKVCKLFSQNSQIQVRGIYSHLYTSDKNEASKQRVLFEQAVRISKRYFPEISAHLGGTYAALLGKEYTFDMVRIGIGLYGYLPDKKWDGIRLPLKKAMRVYAVTICNRKYVFGGKGYGKTCSKAEKEKLKRLSVCRFGYADGFLRKRNNGVENANKNANALCMDVCIRTDNKRRGERVPVLIDANKVAKETDTISYEVLCAATRRAEFIYENE